MEWDSKVFRKVRPGMRILLVEDDPISRTILEHALEAQGHAVAVAEDGEQGWLRFLSDRFEVIIGDWNLPGIQGTEFCRRVRERHSHAYTYFILITAFTEGGRLAEAMDAGVDDFLTKPLDIATLRLRLHVANRILEFHRQIGTLQELLPICMYCKKIRNDKQYWESVETFFSAQTGADFSHSLCPDCYTDKIKPQLDAMRPT
jgi:phosphoserine phosphatase RsbU/P